MVIHICNGDGGEILHTLEESEHEDFLKIIHQTDMLNIKTSNGGFVLGDSIETTFELDYIKGNPEKILYVNLNVINLNL